MLYFNTNVGATLRGANRYFLNRETMSAGLWEYPSLRALQAPRLI